MMMMKSRRPMALLSAAIGVYLVMAPPPAQISHSIMEESDGSRDVGPALQTRNAAGAPRNDHVLLHRADDEGNEHRDSRDEESPPLAQEMQSVEADLAENDVESKITSRPSTNRPINVPAVDAGSINNNKQGEISAESDGEEPRTKSEEETTLSDEPISANKTSTGRKGATSNVPDNESKGKTTPTSVKEKNKTKKSAGPLFHMVFTTGSSTLSTLNVRSIESVFHANPDGRLHIHQPKILFGANNTSGGGNATLLDETHPRLAPLIEHGYNITFHRYDPTDMLKRAVKASIGRGVEVNGTAAEEFIASLPRFRRQEFWYSNESNLLRLALLYVQGGTYMDTDVIILRSHDEPFAGGCGGSGSSKQKRNASAIKALPKDGAIAAPENNVIPFPKPNHPFVAAALNNFMRHFNGTVWGNNGPRVLKRTAWERPGLVCEGEIKDKVFASWAKQLKEEPVADMERRPGSSAKKKEYSGRCVTILDKKKIQPIGYKRWYDYCISTEKSPTGKKAEALLERAYASHLNNKLTGGLFDDQHEGADRQTYVRGSACELLMNKYCSVCP